MPRYHLPSTRYVVLHTVHRDGDQPHEVTVFIDTAGVMNDTTAIRHVRAESDRLHDAPADVTHTLRLVHRTGTGDRDIHTAGPVRGIGAPLT